MADLFLPADAGVHVPGGPVPPQWSGSWDREFEEHRERAWSEEELRGALTEAGFEKVTFTGDLTSRPPRDEEDRWIVRAEKKQNMDKEF